MFQKYRKLVNKASGIAYSANVVRRGMNEFKRTGTTPPEAYGQMVSLYCKTRGISREILALWIRLNGVSGRIEPVTGALGDMSPADIRAAAKQIDEKGYYVFPNKLDPNTCIRLKDFALSEPLKLSPRSEGQPEASVYDPCSPLAVTYRFTEDQLAQNEDVQRLMCDPTFLAVARSYLKTVPVFDLMAMWWTTAFKKEADSDSAQLYHFDMDHNKWIKIFIYLTDVSPENGPHCYIECTHKPLSKSSALLDRGYVRISDTDLRKHYRQDRFKEVCGTAGTIIAGDTAAFHKGKPVVEGHRLVLEFEYGDSLFGANHEKIKINNFGQPLINAINKFPNSFLRIKNS